MTKSFWFLPCLITNRLEVLWEIANWNLLLIINWLYQKDLIRFSIVIFSACPSYFNVFSFQMLFSVLAPAASRQLGGLPNNKYQITNNK